MTDRSDGDGAVLAVTCLLSGHSYAGQHDE
jgi:hypothetical protein